MTISAYVGLPGHGKSYGVVENVIVPALKAKRTVYSNIPMNDDVCLSRFNMTVNRFDIQDIIDNENWWSEVFEPGSVIVLDELWRLWPSGIKANNVRQSDKEFLAEHRHLVGENGASTEIVFVTQDLSQIASFARALVETTFRVEKHSKLGTDKRFRVDVYFGAVTGATPPKSKRQRDIQGKFKKSVYELYKSHTKSATGGAGNEKRVDSRFSILGSWTIKAGILFVILASLFVVWGAQKVLVFYGASEPDVVEVQQPVSIDQVTSKVDRKPKSVDVKKPVFKFLSRADEIVITWNNGYFPHTDFRFTVFIDELETTLTLYQLSKLDYRMTAINECLVKIEGPDFSGVAMCKREVPEKEQEFITSLVTETTDAPQSL